MWDWLFDCFQWVAAKSLFCDYRIIIFPPKLLSSTTSRLQPPCLSGRWAFDWQLVNDVISILLGKWSGGSSRLVSQEGDGNLLRLICCGWWMAGHLQQRGTARLSRLRRDWQEERRRRRVTRKECGRRVKRGRLFIACSRRLAGQCLITFADTLLCCLTLSKELQERMMACCLGEIGGM